MKAIITVLGADRPGIIAQISNLLFGKNINILDISQTILSSYFTMVMLVDLADMNVSYREMTDLLSVAGEQMGMEIRMQRSEIFDAMHKL